MPKIAEFVINHEIWEHWPKIKSNFFRGFFFSYFCFDFAGLAFYSVGHKVRARVLRIKQNKNPKLKVNKQVQPELFDHLTDRSLSTTNAMNHNKSSNEISNLNHFKILKIQMVTGSIFQAKY